MTRNEYARLLEDLGRRMPSLGEWVQRLPDETLELWFVEVFEALDYEFCLTVNGELMRGDHDVAGFKRDRLASVFIKRVAELDWARRERLAKRQAARNASGAHGLVVDDPVMGRAYRSTCFRIRKYRHENGKLPDEKVIKKWAREEFDNAEKQAAPDPEINSFNEALQT